MYRYNSRNTILKWLLPISDLRHQTSSFIHLGFTSGSPSVHSSITSKSRPFLLPPSCFLLQASEFRSQTSDFRPQISDFRPQTSDLRPHTSSFLLTSIYQKNLILSTLIALLPYFQCRLMRNYELHNGGNSTITKFAMPVNNEL